MANKKGFFGLFGKKDTQNRVQWPTLTIKVSPETKAAFIAACGDEKPHAVLKKFIESYTKQKRRKLS